MVLKSNADLLVEDWQLWKATQIAVKMLGELLSAGTSGNEDQCARLRLLLVLVQQNLVKHRQDLLLAEIFVLACASELIVDY